MPTIPARELILQTTEELIQRLPDNIILLFEDGITINSTKKQMVYTSFFWDIHRAYPNTAVKSTHHVNSVLNGTSLSSNTHVSLLSRIFKDVCETYHLDTPVQKEHLLAAVYSVVNNIHNQISKFAEEYITSIDILDFIEVVEHPIIKEANANTSLNQTSINDTYLKVTEVINKDVSLKNNALVKAVKSKMVNANQVSQCVAVRGFLTEVDGSILPVPILSNYTRGMCTLYSYVAESRSAAKALYFSEAPLQDAEYFARRLQLLAMVVEHIAYEDCGSTEYIQWRVNPPLKDDQGNVTYPGDLNFMVGKYYLDENTNKLKEITKDDPDLYNKVLKIRSVFYCKHPDPHTVCEICFSGLAKNVSQFANLGHLSAATMTQQTSQSVLSTKHLDASSVSTNITLSESASKFFTTNRAKNSYIVKKEMKDKDIKITVSGEEAIGLTDILSIDDVDNINPIRVSSIECIDVTYTHKGEEVSIPLFINQGNRKAILTSEFLKYLKTHRWGIDSRNNFVFNLVDWNYSLPVFKLPEMEYSYSDHSHQIAKVIESNMKDITNRMNPHSPVSTLQELFGLVNAKLNVNIAALEIILYATMISSKGDYAMARNSDTPVLGISDQVIKNRSLSSAYAYEDQLQGITNPKAFFKLNRPDSVFDVFLCPGPVVQHYRCKQ